MNTSPELCVLESTAPEQLSVTVGTVQVTIAEQLVTSLFTEMFVGQPVITGFSVSGVTPIVALPVTVHEFASVTVTS